MNVCAIIVYSISIFRLPHIIIIAINKIKMAQKRDIYTPRKSILLFSLFIIITATIFCLFFTATPSIHTIQYAKDKKRVTMRAPLFACSHTLRHDADERARAARLSPRRPPPRPCLFTPLRYAMLRHTPQPSPCCHATGGVFAAEEKRRARPPCECGGSARRRLPSSLPPRRQAGQSAFLLCLPAFRFSCARRAPARRAQKDIIMRHYARCVCFRKDIIKIQRKEATASLPPAYRSLLFAWLLILQVQKHEAARSGVFRFSFSLHTHTYYYAAMGKRKEGCFQPPRLPPSCLFIFTHTQLPHRAQRGHVRPSAMPFFSSASCFVFFCACGGGRRKE